MNDKKWLFNAWRRWINRMGRVGLLAFLGGSCLADIVVISSRPPDATPNPTPATTPCPSYCEVVGSGNWAASTLKSAAPGLPSSRAGSRFATSGTPAFSVTPTFVGMSGTYYVELTHGTASSISADIIVSIAMQGATGLPETTDGFQQTKGVNAWGRIGTMTLDGTTNMPTITFTYSSGTLGASRFYADGIRFINVNDVCLTGLAELTTVNGPLAAGQTFVNVPAVDGTATNVTVYAYDGIAGAHTKLGDLKTGITAGVNRVTTAPLAKGQIIIASQWKGGVESCLSVSGPEVGGFNPPLRVSLSVRDTAGITNVIGANAGGTPLGAHLVFMKGDGTLNGGFGVAPTGGQLISTGACWQTLTFDRAVDQLFGWSGPYGANTLPNDFVALDSIAFALDDITDSGPFSIYLDNFINGTTLIQDFESATNGETAVMINAPSFIPNNSPILTPYLLSPSPGTISPNISVVTNLNASAGNKSLLLSWQFKDSSGQDWYRATFQGTGTPNPVVDLRQPIYFDLLMLPAGQALGNMNVSLLPNRGVFPSSNATFTVTATGGAAPFTYSWTFNDVPIENATGNSVTFTNLQLNQGGIVAVTVSNGDCSLTRRARLQVAERVSMTIERHLGGLAVRWDAVAGDTARLEKTSSLTAPVRWSPVEVVPVFEGPTYMAHIEAEPASPAFYRIVIP